jgi:hypothetical protein
MTCIPVFQPDLDVLGMVIYGSELALWTGVFLCGGYYNFTPWLRERIGTSNWVEQTAEVDDTVNESRAAATGNAVSLHPMPSSNTVFRTPSSLREEARLSLEDLAGERGEG